MVARFGPAYYSGRVNGWKLPKIAGNGCARVAASPKRGRKGCDRRGKGDPLQQLREPTLVTNYCTDVRSMNGKRNGRMCETVILRNAPASRQLSYRRRGLLIIVSITVFHAVESLRFSDIFQNRR